LTDTFVANRLNIRILLTEKIVKEDQWTTRFNRLIDVPLRRYLKRKHLLKPWERAHERN
jgi:predicted HAD superfamily phosphohydrolase YqeG